MTSSLGSRSLCFLWNRRHLRKDRSQPGVVRAGGQAVTALVRRRKMVMDVCAPGFTPSPIPSRESVWRVPRSLPGTRRWGGSDTMPSLVPPAVAVSSPPHPQLPPLCAGLVVELPVEAPAFLSGWAGIFSLPWSLCAWHRGHRGPSLHWACRSLASSSAGGLGYLKDTGTG